MCKLYMPHPYILNKKMLVILSFGNLFWSTVVTTCPDMCACWMQVHIGAPQTLIVTDTHSFICFYFHHSSFCIFTSHLNGSEYQEQVFITYMHPQDLGLEDKLTRVVSHWESHDSGFVLMYLPSTTADIINLPTPGKYCYSHLLVIFQLNSYLFYCQYVMLATLYIIHPFRCWQ